MSSLDSLSSSEGRYRRRRRRNDCQTLSTSNCVESSTQCTAVAFPTNIQTIEEPPNRVYRTHRNRTRRRKSIPMISSYLLVIVAIISIAVNNCYCYAFQSPAIIKSRIQHGLVS